MNAHGVLPEARHEALGGGWPSGHFPACADLAFSREGAGPLARVMLKPRGAFARSRDTSFLPF